MFCSKCGKQLTESARFCSECGAKAGAESVPAISSTQDVGEVTAGGVVIGVAQIVQNYFSQSAPQASEEQLKREAQALQRRIGEYLDWIQDRFGTIVLRGVERSGRPLVALPLDSVYIPLQAEYSQEMNEMLPVKSRSAGRKPGKEDLAVERNESARYEITLDQVLSLGQRQIIIGGPGCGKTTVLQHIAWTLAAALRDGSPSLVQEKLGLAGPPPIPIYAPLNRYAAYLRSLPASAGGREKALATFISEYLLERQTQLAQDADFLRYLLDQGQQVLLLLDGLDEVANEQERALVREKIDDLAAGRKHLRIVVTSRTAAYHDRAVLSQRFSLVRVLPLGEVQIEAIVRQAYQSIYSNSPTEAKSWADDLLQGIQRLEAERRQRLGEQATPLVDSPLMVRLLLIAHYNARKLPDQRADLYNQAVNNLLSPEYSLDEQVKNDLEKIVGGSLATYREILQYLAFQMHQGGEKGREIDEQALRRTLAQNPLYAIYADDLIDQTCQRGTLLEERDGIFRFIHLSFQEFLAARHLVETVRDLESIAAFFESGPALESWWREPALLAVGYLDMNTPIQARLLLERLARLEQSLSLQTVPLEVQLAVAELAAVAFRECKSKLLADLSPRLQARLVDLLQAASLPAPKPLLRASAADALDSLGWLPPDLHAFVRIDVQALARHGLPLPQGVELPLYIAKYPVTNAQYARFLEAEDFADPQLWTGFPRFDENSRPMKDDWGDAGWRWLQSALQDKDIHKSPDGRCVLPRYWNDPRFGIARRGVPVVGLTWYEANAYCRWLLRHWGDEQKDANPGWTPQALRLPSEAEWALAAGGAGNDRYPWDPPGAITESVDEITRRANVSESRIRRTTPVGMHPLGVSWPFGLWDLAGNVWEWQANYSGKEQKYLSLRGGSWDFNHRVARPAFRFDHPVDRWDDLGFRVVASPS